MVKRVKNLAELEQYLKSTIPNAVSGNSIIREVVAQKMQYAVEDVVYEHHEPEQYERREDDGGLSDMDNMQITNIRNVGKGVLLEVSNLTMGADSLTGEYLTPTIVQGIKSNWDDPNGPWSEKRDFLSQTVEYLEDDDDLREAYARTLRSIGLNAR